MSHRLPTIHAGRPEWLALSLALLVATLLYLAPWREAEAAGAAAELEDACRLSGGSFSIDGADHSCCWPGWGCMHCATTYQDTFIEGSCRMVCTSAECAQANDTLTPGNPKLPPSVKRPEAFPGMMAPPKNPQTKKPVKADPAPSTVQ